MEEPLQIREKTLNELGFTIIELLIVVAVIGVIIGLMIGPLKNLLSGSNQKTSAAQIADHMRSIDDGAQLVLSDTTTEIAALTDLATGATAPLKALPSPPSNSAMPGVAANPFVYIWDTTNFTGWGTAAADSMLTLPGVTQLVCQAYNEKYGGYATAAAIPAAVITTKNTHCFGAGTVGNPYTIIIPVYIH